MFLEGLIVALAANIYLRLAEERAYRRTYLAVLERVAPGTVFWSGGTRHTPSIIVKVADPPDTITLGAMTIPEEESNSTVYRHLSHERGSRAAAQFRRI